MKSKPEAPAKAVIGPGPSLALQVSLFTQPNTNGPEP
jgi:hypothetical protein